MDVHRFLRFSDARVEQRQTSDVTFPCPGCRADCEHDVVLIRAPSGLLGRYMPKVSARIVDVLVECHDCHRRFPQEVADRTAFRDR